MFFISICYNSLSQEINEENLLYKKEFEKILDEVLKDTLITIKSSHIKYIKPISLMMLDF